MTDYVRMISRYHPGCIFVCHGDPGIHENIEWVSGDPVPDETILDANVIDDYKEQKILQMSATCAYAIVNGFQSSALGAEHWYDSDPEDQINLIGSVAVGDDMMYPVRDTQDGLKYYAQHTHAQLQTVARDGRTVKLSNMQHFNTKRAEILLAGSKAAVDLVTW